MCFGINFNGQVTSGYTGQVDEAASKLYQKSPKFQILFWAPDNNTFKFKFPQNVNNHNLWN